MQVNISYGELVGTANNIGSGSKPISLPGSCQGGKGQTTHLTGFHTEQPPTERLEKG